MKKFTKMMVGAAMLFGCVAMPLTGCSTMFGEDGFVITDMTWVTDKENNVLITFKTTDDENPEVKVTIPHGLSGKEGVGIKSVTSTNKLDEEGNTIVTIVVKYTDEQLADTIFSVPLKNGKDGKGVSALDVKKDASGNIVIKFKYSDGSMSQDITIPKGIDGNGIDHIDFDDTSDSDNNIITIYFTDENSEPKILNIPKSKDGTGIGMITVDEQLSDEENYVLVISYTNGSEQSIKLPKPKSTIWHSGVGDPNGKNIGNSGDFYLDTKDGLVWKKGGNEWTFLFSMKGTASATMLVVSFHPTVDSEWIKPQLIQSAIHTVPVEYGKCVKLNEFPEIKKAGWTFTGWYSSEEFNVNGGQFTDMTPVTSELDLYPRFIQK